jgi:CheY-like chemotaxis protein
VTQPTWEVLQLTRREPTWSPELSPHATTILSPPPVPHAIGHVPLPASGPRVLIVDDKEDIRDSLRTALEDADEGYQIEEAENGLECFQMIAKMWPDIDVILLDLMMPYVNGFDVLSVTMSFRGCISDVPVIAISGQPDAEDDLPEDARVLFLRKGSFDSKRLRAIVKKAVDAGRERRARHDRRGS